MPITLGAKPLIRSISLRRSGALPSLISTIKSVTELVKCRIESDAPSNNQQVLEEVTKAGDENKGAHIITASKTQQYCAQTNRKLEETMTTTEQAVLGGLFNFLDRSRTVAKPGFSRWMVPPAALCVHLCIGQAYAFSVFNLPMTKLARHHPIGAGRLEDSPNSAGSSPSRFSSSASRPRSSAAGSRKAARAARCSPPALCWAGGFFISAIGVYLHNLWIVYLGYGVVGGCGLGIGYISPVSTLIKWFPDRPGMATGMAIMGFGGGAFIASPLSVWLMSKFLDADTCRRRRDLHRHGLHLFRVS